MRRARGTSGNRRILALACTVAAISIASVTPLVAASPDRDFSGKWVLDRDRSDMRALPTEPDASLTVAQREAALECSATGASGGSTQWSYALDGSESKYRLGGEAMNSVAKWEGAALLVDTLVSGPRNYAIMERWRLSRDRATLSITRHVIRGGREMEAVFIYRREGETSPAAAGSYGPAALTRRAPSATAPDVTVRAGTRIPLALANSVSARHSREGDRIYLETLFPVVRDERVVIPRGSYVTGTVTQAKRPGRVSGKGELYLRFDSITLPNGVTRDLRSRLGAAEASPSSHVDREEGKIESERDKAGAARTVGEAAGAGASVGVMGGGAAGRPGLGAGIGAAAGAAAGLGAVLFSRGPDAALPKGATVEMILDRDLQFTAKELGR